MRPDRCGECGDEFVWDDDAGSAVCPSCGTLQDSQQILLDSHVQTEDNGNERHINPYYARSTLKSFRNANGWDLAGQGAQAAAERNKITMHQFTVALASRIGHHALATRAVYLFDQAVQKGGFRFGRKARLVAGASLIIALRENKKGETVRDIAYLLNETPVALARIFSNVVSLLQVKLVSVDPSWHLPVLQRYLIELKSDYPTSLPKNLINILNSIHLPSALRTAASLSDLISRAQIVAGLPSPPTACAIYILALEGEASSSLPQCGELANSLGRRFGASKDVVMRRYKLIYEHVMSLASDVPWLEKIDKVTRKQTRRRKVPKRVEIAKSLKDIIQFQEGKWKARLSSLGPLSDATESVSSSEITSTLEGQLREEDAKTTLSQPSGPKKRQKRRQIDNVSYFLLHPLQKAICEQTYNGGVSSDFTAHLLTSDEPYSTHTPSRLQLLASLKCADEITDEELFAEGELEGLIRSPEEMEVMAKVCDWTREKDDCEQVNENEHTLAVTRATKNGSNPSHNRINLEALNRFLNQTDIFEFNNLTSDDNGNGDIY